MSEIPQSVIQSAKDPSLAISVRVGKSGLSENLFVEISSQLEARSLVKVKLNRGIFERNDRNLVWGELESRTSSKLVFARGNVGVLWKP